MKALPFFAILFLTFFIWNVYWNPLDLLNSTNISEALRGHDTSSRRLLSTLEKISNDWPETLQINSIFSLSGHNIIDTCAFFIQIAFIGQNKGQILDVNKPNDFVNLFDMGTYCPYSSERIYCWRFFDENEQPYLPSAIRASSMGRMYPIGKPRHYITSILDKNIGVNTVKKLDTFDPFRLSESVLYIFPTEPLYNLLREYSSIPDKKAFILPGWRYDHWVHVSRECMWSETLLEIHMNSTPKSTPMNPHMPDDLRKLLNPYVTPIGAISMFDILHQMYYLHIAPSVYINTCINFEWYELGKRINTIVETSFLFFPARQDQRGSAEPHYSIFKAIKRSMARNLRVFPPRQIYKTLNPERILNHIAAIFIPYAPIISTLVEMYSAGMTIIVPSVNYVCHEVVVKHNAEFLYEFITSQECQNNVTSLDISNIPERYRKLLRGPPPHMLFNDFDTCHNWVGLSFYYTEPGFLYFDSLDELVTKILPNFSKEKALMNKEIILQNVENIMKRNMYEWLRYLS